MSGWINYPHPPELCYKLGKAKVFNQIDQDCFRGCVYS